MKDEKKGLIKKLRSSSDNDKLFMISMYILIGSIILIVAIGSVLIKMNSGEKATVIRSGRDKSSYEVTKYTDERSSSSRSEKSSKTTSSKDDKSSSKAGTANASKTEKQTQAAVVYLFPADINSADLDCLCAAEGIGEELAERIIDYRNSIGVIYNMDLLLNVSGIGEKKLDSLKEYFYVSSDVYRELPQEQPDVTVTVATVQTEPDDYDEPDEPDETQTEEPEPEPPEIRSVNINTADAEEIADHLLIDIEDAEKIIELRELIGHFSSPNELLLNDTMSRKKLAELFDYIEV